MNRYAGAAIGLTRTGGRACSPCTAVDVALECLPVTGELDVAGAEPLRSRPIPSGHRCPVDLSDAGADAPLAASTHDVVAGIMSENRGVRAHPQVAEHGRVSLVSPETEDNFF